MDRTADVYVASVNRAIDVVLADVAGDLSLGRLASEAGFSPFHFHRVFKATVGQTIAEFVGRVRLERAVRRMAHHSDSLGEIALACGFSSSSSFTRAFRNRYGVPPSAFDQRIQCETGVHRIGQLDVEDADLFEVRIRRQPMRNVLYHRVTNPYEPGRLETGTAELANYIESSSISVGRWLGYSWDDPDIVARGHCRYDVVVEVPPDTMAPPPFGTSVFPEMLVAEVDIDGPIELEQQALDWLFGTWLPTSRHYPAEHPVFEVWKDRPEQTASGNFQLSVQLPVFGPSASSTTTISSADSSS